MYNRRPERKSFDRSPKREGGLDRQGQTGGREGRREAPPRKPFRRDPVAKPAAAGADDGSALIVGRQPVLEALRAGRSLERIFILKGASGEVIPDIRRIAEERNVPLNTVPMEKLNSLTRTNHQGVVALSSPLVYVDLQQVVDRVTEAGGVPCLVMLDGVTDVRNIGAIARTALCCGAHAVVIPDRGVGALNEEAVKASAGALQHLSVCRVTSLLKAVDTLHLNGVVVYAAEKQADERVQDMDYTVPCCILLGSEGKGLQSYLSKAADRRFRIPMAPGFDSLNVSVSAGIALFEAFRQRNP